MRLGSILSSRFVHGETQREVGAGCVHTKTACTTFTPYRNRTAEGGWPKHGPQ